MYAGGNHGCDGASQGIDLEEVDGAVEVIDLLRIEFGDEGAQFLSDDVLNDVGLDFGGLFEFVVEGEEDVEDELEGGLVDVGDFYLSGGRCTPPCSMAWASRRNSMTASCFSVSS